jgi:hypothetical protein
MDSNCFQEYCSCVSLGFILDTSRLRTNVGLSVSCDSMWREDFRLTRSINNKQTRNSLAFLLGLAPSTEPTGLPVSFLFTALLPPEPLHPGCWEGSGSLSSTFGFTRMEAFN